MHPLNTIKSENGSALLIAILILCILTIIGISASTNTTIELHIAANEREYVKEFYAADSGWKDGADWLNNLAVPPTTVNTTGEIVRNYGNGGQGVLNDDFSTGTEDGTINGMPYWYRSTYISDSITPGSGREYRKFSYTSTSNANKMQEIEVRLTKIYKVGY